MAARTFAEIGGYRDMGPVITDKSAGRDVPVGGVDWSVIERVLAAVALIALNRRICQACSAQEDQHKRKSKRQALPVIGSVQIAPPPDATNCF
jgi:hypothetical protein